MKQLIAVIFFCIAGLLLAQPNTGQGFSAVYNNIGAREASLAGLARAINDDDLSLAFRNPTLLNDAIKGEAVLSFNPWFNGVNAGFAAYAFQYRKFMILPAIAHFSYGSFNGTDPLGNATNEFIARDIQLSVGVGYIVNERLRVGGSFKYFNSRYEAQGASFIAADLIGSYAVDEKDFFVSFGIENVGVALGQLGSEKTSVPSNVYVVASKKLSNAPFRFVLGINEINRWDNIPEGLQESNSGNVFGEEVEENKDGFGRKLFFHTKLATELVITKNFLVRVGYNYQRREELKLAAVPGTSGFSYGFEFKVNRFRIAYARARYHQAFVNNFFTLSTNINRFK